MLATRPGAVVKPPVPAATVARGFTLIELLLAISILILLLARAVPSFAVVLQNGQIRTAAEALQNGLQIARQHAVQLNTNVQFARSGADWTVSVVNPATTIQSRSSSVDTPNAGFSATQDVVVFNGLGRVAPAPTSLIVFGVTNPHGGACTSAGGPMRCMNVTVQSGGQIRMCDPNLPTTDPQSC